MSTDLSLQLAQKFVEEYENRYDEIMRRHCEAMECRDCEEFLLQGLNAFRWLRHAEETLRQAAAENLCTTPEDMELLKTATESLNTLFAVWLRPRADAEKRIANLAGQFDVAHAKDFRDACEYVQRKIQKLEMQNAIEDAFQAGVFDESAWIEASQMRSV
jgi:hypothetical protein